MIAWRDYYNATSIINIYIVEHRLSITIELPEVCSLPSLPLWFKDETPDAPVLYNTTMLVAHSTWVQQ